MSGPAAPRATRVLAVSSGGGHWTQLLRLQPAFEGCEVRFASVHAMYAADVPGHRFHRIADANRWNPHRLVFTAARLLWVMLSYRPQVVVTTGAAPGVLALLLARRLGLRTVWIDSLANVEEMSMSGRRARRYADLWLTQWPHLAADGGPQYRGSVL